MADPLNTGDPLADIIHRYGPIATGLLLGTAARYGLTVSEGKPFSWRSLVADVLQMGFVGEIALLIADFWHLGGDYRVFAASLTAVGSDRIIRLARKSFLRWAEAQAHRFVPAPPSPDERTKP